jgi:deoxycytidylate deaminase
MSISDSQKILKYVDILYNTALKSTMTHRHAAMIFSGGKPISIGYNHDRCYLYRNCILSCHAEVHALWQYFDQNNLSFYKTYLNDSRRIISLRKRNNNSPKKIKLDSNLKLIVIRINNQGLLRGSKPCCHCLESLKMFGIKKIYYSTDEGKILKFSIDQINCNHFSGRQRQFYKK